MDNGSAGTRNIIFNLGGGRFLVREAKLLHQTMQATRTQGLHQRRGFSSSPSKKHQEKGLARLDNNLGCKRSQFCNRTHIREAAFSRKGSIWPKTWFSHLGLMVLIVNSPTRQTLCEVQPRFNPGCYVRENRILERMKHGCSRRRMTIRIHNYHYELQAG